ncbi:sensor histidine kinase, partial [Glycomyces tenuis]|uniref:sensor histidine kinase n=1 Tax=Glycomyces tenuis TaxID=58116 RepID=UPI003D1571C2
MPPDTGAAGYRIVQEALTNIVRHAGAGTARVALDWRTEGLTITVTDDGVGAGPGPVAGRGLVGIRERARACGGTAAFTAGP